MKKTAFMAFAALALSAGGCGDKGSSPQTNGGGVDTFTKLCRERQNESIACAKALSSSEADKETAIMLKGTAREFDVCFNQKVESVAVLLPENQRKKRAEQIEQIGNEGLPCIKNFFKEATREGEVKVAESCLIPMLKKIWEITCAPLAP